MATRLTAQDASFYFLEGSTTPMHVGSLAVFRLPRGGFSYEELLTLVESRLALVPRYRQKVREVAFGLARPVWVDDRDFDITYHIRRSALPKPGSTEQLHDLVARLTSRPLDRTRPLWEMYLVEGLARNRFAIFTKSHSSIVDGDKALEISQVILDDTKTPTPMAEELWMPAREPSEKALVVQAVADLVSRPGDGVQAVRGAVGDVTRAAGDAVLAVGRFAAVLRTATQTATTGPLNATISRNRRYTVAKTDLDDYRLVRSRFGGTVNDVVLTVVSGALRNWLLSRGEPIGPYTSVRAMVPLSVHSAAAETDDPGDVPPSEVESFLIDLPVGEPNPVVRLSHVSHATDAHLGPGRGVTASTLITLSGFAPATLHAMGARVGSSLSQRMFNILVTNAPGPQFPLYAGGARMLEMYPVPPLVRNQALSIGLTSYDGNVYYGVNADRASMPDIDVIATLLHESLEELVDVARDGKSVR